VVKYRAEVRLQRLGGLKGRIFGLIDVMTCMMLFYLPLRMCFEDVDTERYLLLRSRGDQATHSLLVVVSSIFLAAVNSFACFEAS